MDSSDGSASRIQVPGVNVGCEKTARVRDAEVLGISGEDLWMLKAGSNRLPALAETGAESGCCGSLRIVPAWKNVSELDEEVSTSRYTLGDIQEDATLLLGQAGSKYLGPDKLVEGSGVHAIPGIWEHEAENRAGYWYKKTPWSRQGD